MEALDTTTYVETPEHIRFRYRAAGPSRRFLAWLLDSIIRAGLFIVIVLLLVAMGIMAGGVNGLGVGLLLLILFLIEWSYYVFFETLWGGRTIGKRALRLRVVKEGGYPIGFVDSVLRNLLRAADFLPVMYALGVVVMARDERFRRLGDLVAGTMVIVEERERVGLPIKLVPPPQPAELEAIPGRPPLAAEELEAIELFLRRLGTLSPAREAELAAMVGPIFAKRIAVRVSDATRFLGLLHYRATERKK
jgi:uncharacterized RDD family membrane protein YckC